MIVACILIVVTILYTLSYILPVNATNRLYGSAHFAKNSSLSEENTGLVIDGVRSTDEKTAMSMGCIIAPTGSGKSTQYVLPSLLSGAMHASKIITDPKGSIYELTHRHLAQQGYIIKVLDFSRADSIHFNPLALCHTEEHIKGLANDLYRIAHGDNKSSDRFWEIGSRRLLEILLLCIKNLPNQELHNLCSLITLLNNVDNGTQDVEQFVELFAPDQHTKDRFRSFMASEDKVRMGWIAGAVATLDLWDTKNIKRLITGESFDFASLRKEKTALYLILPTTTGSRYGVFLSLWFNSLFRHLINTEISDDDLSIYITLEELAAIKRIPSLNLAYQLLREKRVSIMSVTQNLSILDYIYGKHITETILGNSGNIIVYPGVKEERTLNFLENLLGERTTEMFVPGVYGVQINKRQLMTKSEIRTMKHALYISGKNPPEKIYPVPIYRNKELMKQASLVSENDRLKSILPPLKATSLLSNSTYRNISMQELLNPEGEGVKKRLAEIVYD